MKLCIFDKDGTLTTTKSGETFVQHPEDQILLPGVVEGITAMAADGWLFAIASNQGGVAAGYKSLDDAIREIRYCLSLLPQIELGLFCPDKGETFFHTGVHEGTIFYPHEQSIYEIEGMLFITMNVELIHSLLTNTEEI